MQVVMPGFAAFRLCWPLAPREAYPVWGRRRQKHDGEASLSRERDLEKFGSIQPYLRSFGTTPSDVLRADMAPSASDVSAKVGAITKLNKCTFSWYPQEDAPRQVTLFRDAKKEEEELYQFILMLSVEGYPEERAYFKGTKVKNVYIDPRNGEEVVQLTTKSIGPKP